MPLPLPRPDEWQTMVTMGATLAKSGLVPSHIKTPEAAVAIIVQGRELGIGAMQALRTIYLVEGRLTLSADLMAALIYRRCGDDALRVIERSPTQCVIDYKRPSWDGPARMTWTFQQAKNAGLTGKQNWQKYPDAMLYARCVSAIAHTAFQDVIMGLYTPDEAEEIAESERPRAVVTDVTPRVEPLTGEIIEDEPRQQQRPAVALLSEKQLAAIYAIGRAKFNNEEAVALVCRERFGADPEQLVGQDASRFIDWLKQQPDGQGVPAAASTLPTGGRLGKKGLEQWLARARAQFPGPGQVEQIVRDLTGATPETMTVVQAREVMEAIEGGLLALDGDGRYVAAGPAWDDEPDEDGGDRRAAE